MLLTVSVGQERSHLYNLHCLLLDVIVIGLYGLVRFGLGFMSLGNLHWVGAWFSTLCGCLDEVDFLSIK